MATGSSVSFWRSQFDQLILQDDGICTDTITEQYKVEKSVMKIFKNLRDSKQAEQIYLFKERHLAYLNNGIRNLSCHFDCLDASRPWLCYWILQSMALLKYTISNEVATDIIEFLKKCKSPSGGYGGGPGQLPHLAPTYAAVLSLCLIGTKEAYDSIDRDLLQNFLTSLHQSDGSFIMHRDGEVDIRGVYCALVPAILTCILTEEMIENTAQWIVSCQSYEGGFSAVPGTEAHGGYTFCGFASLFLLKQPNLCDIQKLLRWACNRQMPLEGGFQGRTNKLVDGCYSFWVGGLFPLLYMALKQSGEEDSLLHPYLWHCHQESLQEYVLYCCQSPHGGLMDKPGKGKDFYHTCYCLSGLSVAQHSMGDHVTNITSNPRDILVPTHPLFNIPIIQVTNTTKYFSSLHTMTSNDSI